MGRDIMQALADLTYAGWRARVTALLAGAGEAVPADGEEGLRGMYERGVPPERAAGLVLLVAGRQTWTTITAG